MIYGSVCSGIEAASVAWHPLGWRAAFLSEIEAFPRAVLAHHYPGVPLHGDFTTIEAGQYAAIDVLVGGTPCQSFSVAGLRGGLADDRGNLALQFLRLADRLRPRWVVWENVPGVLSSNSGRDFGAILGGLAELGYGFAYRVLDAQYFGLAQRRRRVFVVGCLGDWRRAVAVLFERHSLSGHPAPRREAGERPAPTIASRPTGGGGLGTDFGCDGGLIHTPEVARCDATREGSSQDWETTTMVAHSRRADGYASEDGTGRGTPLVPEMTFINPRQLRNSDSSNQIGIKVGAEVTDALCSDGPGAVAIPFDTTQVTSKANRSHPRAGDPCHPLAAGAHPPAIAFTPGNIVRGGGAEPNEHLAPTLKCDEGRGPGDQFPHVAIAFTSKDHGADAGEIAPTLRSMGHDQSHANGGGQVAVAFNWQSGGDCRINPTDQRTDALHAHQTPAVFGGMAVRRLTPLECCRLQGFPDNYLDITYRGKPAADGPKYKALGNSMAVPCMRWIGERIELVEEILLRQAIEGAA